MRGAANATLSQLTTRARSGIRGFFGPDSDEYEQAGACGAHQRAQETHAQSEVVISRVVGRNKISPNACCLRGDRRSLLYLGLQPISLVCFVSSLGFDLLNRQLNGLDDHLRLIALNEVPAVVSHQTNTVR